MLFVEVSRTIINNLKEIFRKKTKKKYRAGRVTSLLIALGMAISIVPITTFADSPSTPDGGGTSVNGGEIPSVETHMVDFGSGSWTVGEQTVTADKNGKLELAMDGVITLNGFDADTMQVKLVGGDGFSTTLNVIDGKTKLSEKNSEGLPREGALTFSVEKKAVHNPDLHQNRDRVPMAILLTAAMRAKRKMHPLLLQVRRIST